jgi:hypothetical protein
VNVQEMLALQQQKEELEQLAREMEVNAAKFDSRRADARGGGDSGPAGPVEDDSGGSRTQRRMIDSQAINIVGGGAAFLAGPAVAGEYVLAQLGPAVVEPSGRASAGQ